MPMKFVLASRNAKKLVELAALFSPLGCQLVSQASLGVVDEAAEPHPTFVENALAKARHASRKTGRAAIADDSGLCVDALGGAPGVVSARYAQVAGEDAHGALPASAGARAGADETSRRDAANNAVLLRKLDSVADRRARFVSVLVATRSATDPEPLIAIGRWEGTVLTEPRGSAGFGYDPLLFIPELGCSVAELDAATKNAHSHRAIAARRLLALMRDNWPAPVPGG
jgi:XTP/dITP diphosphohydrolase